MKKALLLCTILYPSEYTEEEEDFFQVTRARFMDDHIVWWSQFHVIWYTDYLKIVTTSPSLPSPVLSSKYPSKGQASDADDPGLIAMAQMRNISAQNTLFGEEGVTTQLI